MKYSEGETYVKWLKGLGLYQASVEADEAIHRRKLRHAADIKAQAADRLRDE